MREWQKAVLSCAVTAVVAVAAMVAWVVAIAAGFGFLFSWLERA